jgi:hypothetical protein
MDSDSDQHLRIDLTLAASDCRSSYVQTTGQRKIQLAELIARAFERGILVEEVANLTGLDAIAVQQIGRAALTARPQLFPLSR